jgi:hypothetical protein
VIDFMAKIVIVRVVPDSAEIGTAAIETFSPKREQSRHPRERWGPGQPLYPGALDSRFRGNDRQPTDISILFSDQALDQALRCGADRPAQIRQ